VAGRNGRGPRKDEAHKAADGAPGEELHASPVVVLDPKPEDPRLATVGSTPSVWADGSVLTVAVRDEGRVAPFLVGTVYERMRPAGEGLWALRIRVHRLERARFQYQIVNPDKPYEMEGPRVWSGSRALVDDVPLASPPLLEPLVIDGSDMAAAHPVYSWSPTVPGALLVCADGEGLATTAAVIAAAGEQVALLGIANGGISHRIGEEIEYDRRADPRARAYLYDVDPPYFAAHMRYVVATVLPWADERFGQLPRLVFGVSNGAAWAAQAAFHHGDLFEGAIVFSLGAAPPGRIPAGLPPHALLAGQLEPGFHRTTCKYAWKLRSNGTRVRLRRPVRGHDYTMWNDELIPALRWVLGNTTSQNR
jgi:Putative esterase